MTTDRRFDRADLIRKGDVMALIEEEMSLWGDDPAIAPRMVLSVIWGRVRDMPKDPYHKVQIIHAAK